MGEYQQYWQPPPPPRKVSAFGPVEVLCTFGGILVFVGLLLLTLLDTEPVAGMYGLVMTIAGSQAVVGALVVMALKRPGGA